MKNRRILCAKQKTSQVPSDNVKGWRVIEVYIAKICAVCNPEICLEKNVAQMSKPIRVEVKYVQGYFNIINFGIYC